MTFRKFWTTDQYMKDQVSTTVGGLDGAVALAKEIFAQGI